LIVFGTIALTSLVWLAGLPEELGITPPLGRHLVIDWAPATGEGDKILFVFDGGMLAEATLAKITLQADELAEWRFVAETELDSYVPARLARRLRTALKAKAEHRTAYAEHGEEPE
jgi:8-oxo-dGTP diphosphatase